MTSAKRQNLESNKQRYLADISAIDRTVREIALSGSASASISAGGGAKSYTRLDLDKLLTLRRDLAGRVTAINRALRSGSPGGIRHIEIVRC